MSGVWNPVRPSLDRLPPLDPPHPAVSYVVCSTPRSGSGLLCRGLADTGMAGTPAEYFNANQRDPLSERWGCGPEAASYACALRAHRTGPDGCFGLKLHWSQLLALRDEVALGAGERSVGSPSQLMEELLPGSILVHVLRLDIDAQAVSLWVAHWTQEWAQPAKQLASSRRRVPYSYAGIERCRQEIIDGEIGWQRLFAVSGITPITVVYEHLADDYARQIQATLARIRPGVTAPDIGEPTSRRQGNEMSERLIARYVDDRARRRRLASGPSRAMSVLRRAAALGTLKR